MEPFVVGVKSVKAPRLKHFARQRTRGFSTEEPSGNLSLESVGGGERRWAGGLAFRGKSDSQTHTFAMGSTLITK